MCERLEQRRLLAVVSTSFEGINSSDFTIGDSPEAARFSGDAFSGVLGVPQLYRTGSSAWMVNPQGTGVISFQTPAQSMQFHARLRSTADGPTVITAFDAEDQVLDSVTLDNPNAAFQRVEFRGPISRIEVANNSSAANSVNSIDDFSFESSTQFDFGDAPTAVQSGFAGDYPTTLADDGARHSIGSGLFLGQTVDAEVDGFPDGNAGLGDAGGDDNDGEDDEDGVEFLSSLVAVDGSATRASVLVSASQVGRLDAWIDFNQNGDWDDAGEQIFNAVDVAAGLNLLSFTVPAGATPGATGARFRLSSAGGLAPTGAAPDGEVEDYIAMILDGDAEGRADVEIDPPVSGTVDVIADGNDVVVRSGAIELFRAPGSSLNHLDIFGRDGDDTLNVANLDAIFSGLVGGNAGGGNDTLRLTGSGQDLDLTQIADIDIQGIETIDIRGSGDNTLTLDSDEVANISSTTDTLIVRHNKGDTVNYGVGWTVDPPNLFNGEFRHVLQLGFAVSQVVNSTPWQNRLLALDPNRDGVISPVDALIPINALNETGSQPLGTPTSQDTLPEFYLDTNGDNFNSPIDVLLVVNFLNDPQPANSEGEGPASISSNLPILPRIIFQRMPRVPVHDRYKLPVSDEPSVPQLTSANSVRRVSSHGERVDVAMQTPSWRIEVSKPLEALLDDLAANVVGKLLF